MPSTTISAHINIEIIYREYITWLYRCSHYKQWTSIMFFFYCNEALQITSKYILIKILHVRCRRQNQCTAKHTHYHYRSIFEQVQLWMKIIKNFKLKNKQLKSYRWYCRRVVSIMTGHGFVLFVVHFNLPLSNNLIFLFFFCLFLLMSFSGFT